MAELNTITGFVKEPATISKQLEKLKQRGLIINDEKYAVETLNYINYYRLVHYFSVFLDDSKSNKCYKAGTTFKMGLRLYDFDRYLRNVLLIVLEDIEVSMRAVISNYHALKYGALGYLNASSFDRIHKHQTFLNKVEYMIETNSGEGFVSHYKHKYNGAFPLWVIMELFSFGTLYYFFLDMKQSDKKELTERYFKKGFGKSEMVITYKHLDSWLECLSALRNHCAHYNRIYANNLKIFPRTFPLKNENNGESGYSINKEGSLFDLTMVMKYLYKRSDKWKKIFTDTLENLFLEYRDVIEIKIMGFPENWNEILVEYF